MKYDANDIARKDGLGALRKLIDTEKPKIGRSKPRTTTATAATDDPDLCEMNEKYAVVLMGGKTRVVYFDDDRGGKLPVFQTISDFKAFHAKRRKSIATSSGGTREEGIGSWWIGHPERRQYESIGYRPNDNDPARLNLWQGFAFEPKQGDCSLYLRHITDNICAGNAEHLRYLLNWMAHGVQRPGTPPGTAIVLKGKEGVGKGAFVTQLGRCFGAHFLHISQGKHLTGNFNSHLQQCTLLFADEAFFAGDRGHESILKALITEETMMIEPKGLDPYSVKNCIHLVMASNSDWVVPAGADARRFFVLDVADAQMQNTEYFAAIKRQMENGGQEALLWQLLNRDISTFEVRSVPHTAALAQQKQFSRRGVDQLIEILAHEGELPNAHEKNPRIAVTTGEDRGQGFWASARRLVPELKYKSAPVIASELKVNWACRPWKSHGRRGVEFPSLSELRQMFDARHGSQGWPDPGAEWGQLDDPVDGNGSLDAS
jgi:hypothetical protein